MQQSACARWDRWLAESRTTSTTPMVRRRSTPKCCWNRKLVSASERANTWRRRSAPSAMWRIRYSRMREFYRQQEPELVLAAECERIGSASDRPGARALVRYAAAARGTVIELRLSWRRISRRWEASRAKSVQALINPGVQRRRCHAGWWDPDHSHQSRREFLQDSRGGCGSGRHRRGYERGNQRRRCLEPFFTTKGDRGTAGLAMVYGVTRPQWGARSKWKVPSEWERRFALLDSRVICIRTTLGPVRRPQTRCHRDFAS